MATFNCICIYNCNCKCICICICICNWVSGGHIGLLEGSATLTRFRLCCRLFFSTLFNCILFSLTVKATAKTARRRICAMHTPHTRPFCPKLYNCRRTGRLLNGLQLKRVSNCILIMLFIWLNFETLSYRAFFFFLAYREKFREQTNGVHLTFERAKLSTAHCTGIYVCTGIFAFIFSYFGTTHYLSSLIHEFRVLVT